MLRTLFYKPATTLLVNHDTNSELTKSPTAEYEIFSPPEHRAQNCQT